MCGDNNEAKGDILLCDSCDAEYHLACCTPPLKACPEGEWFCLTCRVNKGEPVSVLFNEVRPDIIGRKWAVCLELFN